jgi:uncharacterized OB-fold protein
VTELAGAFADATTASFWEGAARGDLLIQRCRSCAEFQFYPRPFCLACGAADPVWVAAAGQGTVYAMTTVHLQVDPTLEPPYVVGIVTLDEGPRLVTNLIGNPAIGDRVRVSWRERRELPPLPIFARAEEEDD